MKRVLMVAYHFPPLAGSSGIQRTLRFVQELPALGWQPLVLSADPRAYERSNDDLMADIPPGTIVERAFALDASRHLSIKGRHLGITARPDRWMSWKFAAIHHGMRLIRRFAPQAVWSTYPIATAHLIGAGLHRRTGLPWLADFRDPMAQDGYPPDPKVWQSFKDIELCVMREAAYGIFTTPSAMHMYAQRYPHAADRLRIIENGYDETSFAAAEAEGGSPTPLNPGAVTLLHSGIVYPSERDPTQLFAALGQLVRHGTLVPGSFKLRFRAAVHEDLLQRLTAAHRLEAFVECCPPVGYREALREMMAADGLLVMQAANCNEQIPAKVYEYLRARRPIIGLTDPAGDTETVLRAAGVDTFARIDSSMDIARMLPTWIAQVRCGEAVLPTLSAVQQASRGGRALQLAQLLDAAGER